MGMLDKIEGTKKDSPRRILLYGVEGIGKSTFASRSINPVFIRTESGLDDIDTQAFPLAESYSDVMQATYELASQDHSFDTLVLDSADWFEKLIFALVCEEKGVESVADIDYGRGYALALAHWDKWIDIVNQCHAKGMNIIILAHSAIVPFADPNSDTYDRYAPRLHKHASARLREWCDEVLFANYETFTTEKKEGFGDRTRAVGSGNRVLNTTERPSHMAKNRIAGMPDQIELDFETYWKYVKGVENND